MPRRKHPIIAAWIDEHERFSRRGLSAFQRRTYRLLDELFSAAEAGGLKPISEGISRFHFKYQNVKIRCDLDETKFRVKKTDGGGRPTFALESREKLKFTIHHGSLDRSITTEWSEKKSGALENQIQAIVRSLLQVGPALVEYERRELDELRARVDAAEARRREEARLLAERKRVSALIKQAKRHQTALELRQLLAALEAAVSDADRIVIGDRTLAEWFAWANEQVRAIDPLEKGAGQVFASVAGNAVVN